MSLVSLCRGLSLSLGLVVALGAGCANDDKKVALQDADAGEGAGGEPTTGGNQNSGASSGSSAAGAAGEAGGTHEGDVMGDGGTNAGGAGGGVGGVEAGAPQVGGGSGEAGVGGVVNTDPTPVPSACIGCASDFCVAARSACQNDATCVSCRDENYRTLACAQNAAFIAWIQCICASGCSAACTSLCGF